MWRPRIKFEHRPVRYRSGLVRIGGAVPGIARGLRDPDGSVWALLVLLDGTRSVGRITAELTEQYPARTEAEVREAITALNLAGYLENAADAWLSESERERYSRAQAWWRWVDSAPDRGAWDAQLQLRKSRVVVIGVGGAGGAAAEALVASGVGQVHCVDPDVVQLSNLNRQTLFSERDLGRAKTEAAVDRLKRLNSHVEVSAARDRIEGSHDLRPLAMDCDVLVLAADEPTAQEIRSWTNKACHDTGTAWVHTGYHGPRVSVGLFRPGTGPCYDCRRVADEHHREAAAPLTPWPPAASAKRVHAVSAVSAGMAGCLAAHAAMSLITGAPPLPVNREYGLNLITLGEHNALDLAEPQPDCPTCGENG